ncbi:MAG: hypothetical protein ABL929_11825 [Ferruginibacter sp.]|nr:hypothetical protein [Ferruginibacter sp.]
MKKLIITLVLPIFLFALIITPSCKKNNGDEPIIVDDIDPTAGLTKQHEGYAIGAATKIAVYTKSATITTGYNKFYLSLTDSVTGKRVEDAHIMLMPMMDMGAMQHTSPTENPASEMAVNKLFPCAVVFMMPTSASGTWTVEYTVHNHVSNKEGKIKMLVNVIEPTISKQKMFTALHNGEKYLVSLIDPSTPKVGINDMEIAIFKRASMMSFPADSSLSVVLTPEMPSMGHGSPNNVNPAHVGKGHYKGKVNFTMTGMWKLNLDYKSGAAVADTTQFFDVQF